MIELDMQPWKEVLCSSDAAIRVLLRTRKAREKMAQKKRTRLEPQVRRTQLLDAAATIIAQHGLSGFTMDALAKEAGVSNPLVYTYFSTRRALLEELLELEFDRYRDDVQERLNAARSFEDIVRIFVTKNFDEAARGNVTQILRSQPDIQKSINKKMKKEERRFARFLVNHLADTFALTRTQAERMAVMGSGASVAAAERARKSGSNREGLIDDTVSFIVGGIESYRSSD
jgi:AcrR family transcriptional regulator